MSRDRYERKHRATRAGTVVKNLAATEPLESNDVGDPFTPPEPVVIYDEGGRDEAWHMVACIRSGTPYRVVELRQGESCGHGDCQRVTICPQCRRICLPSSGAAGGLNG